MKVRWEGAESVLINNPVPWTSKEVRDFLDESYRVDITLAQLVAESRRRFPEQKPRRLGAQKLKTVKEVDPYLERFLLDVVRIVAAPNVVDALLSVPTPNGKLANVTRP
jgi:hypothetical protein